MHGFRLPRYFSDRFLIEIAWTYYGDGWYAIVRREDDNNYMAWHMKSVNGCGFRWETVIDGERQVVVNSERSLGEWGKGDCFGPFIIEVNGNTYKVKKRGRTLIEFEDPNFSSGGIGIVNEQPKNHFTIDDIEVNAVVNSPES